jgi:uncharacterized protein
LELQKLFVKLFLVQNDNINNTAQNENANLNAPEWKELYEYEHNRLPIVPTPNNPPWNGWAAILVWLASVFFIVVVPNIILIPYLLLSGQNFTKSDELVSSLQNNPTVLLLSILGVIPAHILTLLLAWFVVTNYKKFSFREMLGWKSGGFAWWYYILIIIGFFSIAAVVGYFIPQEDNELLRILRSSRTIVFAVAFMATFTAPIVEEVIYRGVLYSAFQRKIGVAGSVFIVTALFALVHVPQYYPSVSTIILICLLSLVLTLIRVKTDNLLPCIILHTIFNGIQSALLIAEPYIPTTVPPIQEQTSAIIRLIT